MWCTRLRCPSDSLVSVASRSASRQSVSVQVQYRLQNCDLNLTILKRFYTKERKRFYKAVTISQQDGQFQVNLDRRRLRTPLGNIVTVPNEPLALSVATEWEAQKEVIHTPSMYISRLCNKAIDNPLNETADERIDQILPFLDTDTICFRAEEPPVLVALQETAWDPVMQWVEQRFDVIFGSSTSVTGPQIPADTKEKVRKFLCSFDSWSLIGRWRYFGIAMA